MKIIPGPKLIFQNLLVHSQPPGCRGLRQVPPPPLLQYQLFVLPSGQVAKVSRLYLSADVSNKHPQILGGLCQHTVISHTTALWVRWGFRSKLSLLQDPGCRGSPSGGTTAEEMRQIGTSSRSICLLGPLPLPFHWLKQVTWPGPIFKRVGKCDLFLWQEFWQMASVTPLHTSRSCPSESLEFPPYHLDAGSLSPAWSALTPPSLCSVCPGFGPCLSHFCSTVPELYAPPFLTDKPYISLILPY